MKEGGLLGSEEEREPGHAQEEKCPEERGGQGTGKLPPEDVEEGCGVETVARFQGLQRGRA